MKELLPFWKPYQTLEAFTKPKTVKGETAIEIFVGIEYKGGSSRMFINSDRRFVWDSFYSDIIIQ